MRIFLLFTALIMISGCGDNIHQSGKVVFEDGSPVPCGDVCFINDTYQASGTILPDGTFTMGSTQAENGLKPGTYKVVISGSQKVVGEDPREKGAPLIEYLVEDKYTDPDRTPLNVEVKKRNTNLVFKVGKRKNT
ncbi:MAG: carboxypeptidase-like regulatory domain-containing protein [Planctomycetaceae bacterium]|jgi:hypothetical protein|nr:carboxypeptidase-like regulatory domain-containing protein [Planctomycetaceae bacterium]